MPPTLRLGGAYVSAAYRHLGVTRFEHHRDPGRVRRGGCERGLILGFGASAPPRHSLLHGGIHSTVEWKRAAYRHLGVTRFEHHRDPGRVRRGGCERGLILGFGLW